MKYTLLRFVAIVVFVLAGGAFFLLPQHGKNPLRGEPSTGTATTTSGTIEKSPSVQYLAFQIFTGTSDSPELSKNLPAPVKDISSTVSSIVSAIGTSGTASRRLAFIVGPLSFDTTDDQVRQTIRDAFATALQKSVAVGFHIDDSMFWGRMGYLNNPSDIEWLDWNKTLNTSRQLNVSATPTKGMPQLCLNSPDVKSEVTKRATLIGEEVRRGIATLEAAGEPELFAGVIAGWGTQIGLDFETKKPLGYCALANRGYSANKPPKDIDQERADVVKEFVDLWAKSLFDAGVPDEKIFSQITFKPIEAFHESGFGKPNYPASYLQGINFSPPSVAFGAHHYAGFKTSLAILGTFEAIQAGRISNGNPPWASSEGTVDNGNSMEPYLGSIFNHGAALVNIFGWGVGNNPAVEASSAIEAYKKFFRGDTLAESPMLSPQLHAKIDKARVALAAYFQKNHCLHEVCQGEPGAQVSALYKTFSKQLGTKDYTNAEKTLDTIFTLTGISI